MTPADDIGTGGQGERRQVPRRRLLKHVQVLSLDKRATSAVDLMLRNTSPQGARLYGPPEARDRIPEEFYLVAPGQLRMVRCKVVWRGRAGVGISFLSDPGALASLGLGADGDARGEDYHLDHTNGAVVRRSE